MCILKPAPTVDSWSLFPLEKFGRPTLFHLEGEREESYMLLQGNHCLRAVPVAHPACCMEAKEFFYNHRKSSDRNEPGAGSQAAAES